MTVFEKLDRARRQFACLCAREAASIAGVPTNGLIVIAERFTDGAASREELAAARARAGAAIAGAGAVGLPRCMPAAAALLSAYHTCEDDAAEAARLSAAFAVKTILFKEAEVRSARWFDAAAEHRPSLSHAARWMRRFGRDLDAVEGAARARYDRLLQSVEARACGRGRVLAFCPENGRARPTA